jgi:hypothetical protein
MDNIYHNLTSFLAIWFRNLQKSTYNVNVINKEADKVSPLLYEKLQAIHFLLQDLGDRELKVKVSNQKELNTKDLEDKLSALLSGVNSIELDNSTVERLLSDLISLSKGVKKVEVLNQPEMPTKMNVVGKVEVSNLPKVQEVTGDFNLKESKDILNSLKELASEIRDLKLESIQGYKSIGQTFVGSTGSREAHKLTDGTKTATITTSGANNALDVNIVAGGAGNGAILDGVDSDIKATVKDLTNSNPLTVALVDGSGDHITSIGGGTQYTEGDTDATIVGTAIMWEDAGNALTPVSSAKPLPVSASIDPTGLATSAKQDTIIGHVDGIETLIGTTNTTLTTIDGRVDGIEGLLTTIDSDTSSMVAGYAAEGAALGSGVLIQGDDGTDRTNVLVDTSGHLQVDVLTLPAGGSGLTDAELRASPVVVDLGANNDVTVTGTVDLGATDNAVLDAIAASVAAIDTDTTTIIGHVDGIETLIGTTNTTLTTIDGRVDGIEALLGTIDADTSNLSTKIDTIAGDTTAIETAVQLIDDAIYVDDADWTADTSKHALVGGVTQVTPSANTDGDTTPLITNALRELRIAPMETDMASAGGSHVHKPFSYTGAQTDAIIWSPAAGKRFHITDYGFVVSAACTVTFEDDRSGGDVSIGIGGSFAANSGKESPGHATPIFSGEDAADLVLTTSAGNIEGYVSGYEL